VIISAPPTTRPQARAGPAGDRARLISLAPVDHRSATWRCCGIFWGMLLGIGSGMR
jgi:hypothetical protein